MMGVANWRFWSYEKVTMEIKVGIITISDRASKGLYDDLGGPALRKHVKGTIGGL
jgi:molybdopterin biosynthesis enzyme MoaB